MEYTRIKDPNSGNYLTKVEGCLILAAYDDPSCITSWEELKDEVFLSYVLEKEVVAVQKDLDPEEVFTAFNELIQRDFDGREAVVKIGEVRNLIKSQLLAANKELKDWMLNVEDAYRKTGKWRVERDKPGYNESYEGFYTFTRK